MSVHVEWDNEERTRILWSFVGRWTWGEFDEAVKVVIGMVANVEHPVDLLIDVRQMSILPPDIVKHVKTRYLSKPKKMGRLIAVGVDNNLQLFWNIFTDLPYAQSLKLIYFETLEEARAFASGNPQ